ncbi:MULTISPECIES: GNAT family N-acetyltransferase [unclassified Geodermatophilus]|uniref:GNAT family N-acetyltransferase n=1 Tax=unclassified Geodermatophilus TaxID=2637632 RepID=UPI003EED4CA4
MRIVPIDPAADDALARELLAVQAAAYAVEAALIGDDRIPPLREDLDGLRGAGLAWLGALGEDGRLAGALGWSDDGAVLDVERLVVAPTGLRRGTATALVRALLGRAGPRPAVVATGRDNVPARALYERLGFVRTGDREVLPGLWVTAYRHGG